MNDGPGLFYLYTPDCSTQENFRCQNQNVMQLPAMKFLFLFPYVEKPGLFLF